MTFPDGTVLTASAHLPGSFPVAIRIGKNSFTVGFWAWWRIGGDGLPAWQQYFAFAGGFTRIPEIHLLPHPATAGLRFGYADSLDFSSKQEAERALGRFFLINLDEFDQITMNQQGFLKHLLQKPVANLRKPYGTSVRELRRYASFIGTSNQKDLLTDPTGSRRFICIEVTAPIDTHVTIDYRQLYAQAMTLLYQQERYWLNDEDEAVLRQSNSEFEQISPLEHLFHCNFLLLPLMKRRMADCHGDFQLSPRKHT